MAAPDRLLITEPGFDAPFVAALNGIDCSWAMEQRGTFSSEVVSADLITQYGTTDLRGYWTRWEHPTLGAHSGVIEDVVDSDGGTTELAGREMGAILAKRRTTKDYDVQAASPGGLAKRAISDASRERFTWITRFEIDNGGDPITGQVSGATLIDLVDIIARSSESEWRVDDGRESAKPTNGDILVFRWGRPLGLDRTTVVFTWGREVLGFRVPRSIRPMVNRLLIMPADERYSLSQAFTVEDRASIEAHGELEDTLIIEGRVAKSVTIPIAKAELRRLVKLGSVMTLTIGDVDDAWSKFRHGDRITVTLPTLNIRADFRVMVRSYSSDRNELVVAGDWTVAA